MLAAMKFAAATIFLCLNALAAAQPPATAPALPAAGRDTPIGTCRLFDQTVADIGIEKALQFYHCTNTAQRRFARSECEFFIALNRLVRSSQKRFGDAAAASTRAALGDNDDYTRLSEETEGDSSSLTRAGEKPLRLVKLNDQWFFSMPDWFQQQAAEDLQATRLYYENSADVFDALREQLDSGKIATQGDLEEQVRKIAAAR